MSQACTVTAPSEDVAEYDLTRGDSDAFPAFSSGGEEPRARVAACQGHSEGVASANVMRAKPQDPLPPQSHGRPVEFDRDDTDSLNWSAESEKGRTCSEAGIEGVHEDLLVDDEVPEVRPSAAVTRQGFAQLDEWDLVELSKQCGCLMRSVPRFSWGSFRICLKIALGEIVAGASRRNVLQQERGWKLLLLFLPRMMLDRAPRGGLLGEDRLVPGSTSSLQGIGTN